MILNPSHEPKCYPHFSCQEGRERWLVNNFLPVLSWSFLRHRWRHCHPHHTFWRPTWASPRVFQLTSRRWPTGIPENDKITQVKKVIKNLKVTQFSALVRAFKRKVHLRFAFYILSQWKVLDGRATKHKKSQLQPTLTCLRGPALLLDFSFRKYLNPDVKRLSVRGRFYETTQNKILYLSRK